MAGFPSVGYMSLVIFAGVRRPMVYGVGGTYPWPLTAAPGTAGRASTRTSARAITDPDANGRHFLRQAGLNSTSVQIKVLHDVLTRTPPARYAPEQPGAPARPGARTPPRRRPGGTLFPPEPDHDPGRTVKFEHGRPCPPRGRLLGARASGPARDRGRRIRTSRTAA